MARVASSPRRFNLVSVFLWLLGGGLIAVALLGAFLTLSKGRYSIENWESFIVSGIALGSVYALIALGYTLVYGILFMINFAHGEVFMFGTFTALFAARFLADNGLIASQPILSFVLV